MKTDESSKMALTKCWWVGQRAIDCLGLHHYLDFNYILCCDHGDEHALITKITGAKILSLEAFINRRKSWSNYHIEEAVRTFQLEISSILESEGASTIVLYRASRIWEELSQIYPINIAAASSELVKQIDDNFFVFRKLTQEGFTQPKGWIGQIDTHDTEKIIKDLGIPCVLKRRISASGSGCYIVRSVSHLLDYIEKFRGEDLLVTEFINGRSYNIHGMIADNRVLVTKPSLQIVGVPECSRREEIYCGNDFSILNNEPELIDKLQQETHRIGLWLMSLGYQGIFGVDFVGDSSLVVAVDINPRFQGSTWLLSQIEHEIGLNPLGFLHTISFHNQNKLASLLDKYSSQTKEQPFFGSQLIFHSRNNTPVVIQGTIPYGVYRYTKSGLDYVHPGSFLVDCKNDGEFLLTCGVPKKGLIIEPDSSILKLVMRSSLIDEKTGSIKKDIIEIVNKLYERMMLTEI